MLIGCIAGPDFISAKRQVENANQNCKGIELRIDFLEENIDLQSLISLCKGISIITDPKMQKSLFTLQPDYFTVPWDYKGEIPDTKIIRAYHNFSKTPEDLEAILKAMPKADIYKIATTAQKTTDAMRMLNFVKGKKNIIGICMGPFGEITRILGPIVGNVFDFAKIEEEAAPGQLSPQELIENYNYNLLNSSTSIFGVIGYPLTKSRSSSFHNGFFKINQIDAVYVKFPLLEEELKIFFSLAKGLQMRGASVTMPHKEKVYPFIDSCEETAKEIGAINTLTFSDGEIRGANTDAEGALDALEEHCPVADKDCVILGAGGAAKAIAYEAKKRGAKITILNRTIEKAKSLAEQLETSFGNLDTLESYKILINTTPNPMPIPKTKLKPNTVVMEITIANSDSAWMQHAQSIGCLCVFGMAMFEKQAMGQYTRWGIIPS